MNRISLCFVSLLCVFAASSVMAQADHKLAIVDEKLDRIQAELEAIQFQQKKLEEKIAAFEQELQVLRQAQGGGVSAVELKALDARITALDAKREQDRKLILDTLSKEMAAIASGGTVSDSGIVHTVAKGETLGAIARQYGVTVADLVKINRINNPNAIQIGQELVIPK